MPSRDRLQPLPAVNRRHEYVASRTLTSDEELPWQNSSLLRGDATKAVGGLKSTVDGDLVVLGSGELVRSLARAGLVDVLMVSIHPLTLGSGTRLFGDDYRDVGRPSGPATT